MVLQSLMVGSHNTEGKLQFSGSDVCEMVSRYGSPLLIVSEDMISENLRNLKDSFRIEGLKFSFKYAMKANPNPAILNLVRKSGAGIDSSSEMELRLALASGFSSGDIIFSPNNAPRKELQYAVGSKVAINFDSLSQFRQVMKAPPRTASFRIKTHYGRGEFKGTTTAGPGTKFGITADEAPEAYRVARDSGVEQFGIHVMAGSNVLDPEHFRRVAESICRTALEIENKADIKFRFIDIGGGLGVPYRPDVDGADLHSIAQSLAGVLTDSFGDSAPEILMEPGRFIVSNAAVLAGTVTDIKKQDRNYLGCDIGMNLLLRPALYGAYHHIVLANRLNDPVGMQYDVTGQICENTDRIGTDIQLPEARIGDTIAVFNAGAYVSSMSSNYNGRLRAAEIMVSGGSDRLIRKRDTYEDFVGNYI